jgi:hypothetical protein
MSSKLFLPAADLHDSEYKLYATTLLSMVFDDVPETINMNDQAYFENMILSVRDTRTWLRGRYRHIPFSIVNKVSHCFIPFHPF